ncbi:helix-turn-helix domain-containing protein [Terrabacter terrigena]|uniref:Helix-turn-helix domain-containing protein n=1 Tax=Terrabacter terrigena TaxID=574718 RepID=A0ABW3N2V6_9MICO
MTVPVRMPRATGPQSVLTSPGSLLRAWRKGSGLTQVELGEQVHVSAAAVSAWETGVRGIPARALDQLDTVLRAGGCLAGLSRSIGTSALEPRTRWSHAFHGSAGPVWAWVRPPRAGRVQGLARLRVFALGIDHEVGPEGLFVQAPRLDPNWAVTVHTQTPVWVDFGEGVPPDWLGVPRISSAALRDVVLSHPGDPMLTLVVDSVQGLAGGNTGALRTRLRRLVDAQRWDLLEAQWRRGEDAAPPPVASDGPRPPRSAEGQRALHRRLRNARGMSQAETAAAVTRLLHERLPTAPVTGHRRPAVSMMQIHNYESGRRARVPHLPALLDRAYDAYGFSCFEPVRTSRVRHDTVATIFPDFWLGPVTLAVRAVTEEAGPGPLRLSWRNRRIEVPLASASLSLGCLRFPEDGDLTVRLPQGWTADVRMGYDPDAVELVTDWVPVSPEVGLAVVDRVVSSLGLAVGVSESDLQWAVRLEEDGADRRVSATGAVLPAGSTGSCTSRQYAPGP